MDPRNVAYTLISVASIALVAGVGGYAYVTTVQQPPPLIATPSPSVTPSVPPQATPSPSPLLSAAANVTIAVTPLPSPSPVVSLGPVKIGL